MYIYIYAISHMKKKKQSLTLHSWHTWQGPVFTNKETSRTFLSHMSSSHAHSGHMYSLFSLVLIHLKRASRRDPPGNSQGAKGSLR